MMKKPDVERVWTPEDAIEAQLQASAAMTPAQRVELLEAMLEVAHRPGLLERLRAERDKPSI